MIILFFLSFLLGDQSLFKWIINSQYSLDNGLLQFPIMPRRRNSVPITTTAGKKNYCKICKNIEKPRILLYVNTYGYRYLYINTKSFSLVLFVHENRRHPHRYSGSLSSGIDKFHRRDPSGSVQQQSSAPSVQRVYKIIIIFSTRTIGVTIYNN